MLDVIIVGSGPAGMTAAIYAKRAGLDAVLAEREYMGTGQIAVSSRVDNYPGLPGLDGYSLGEKFRQHAEELGAEFIENEVTGLAQKDGYWTVMLADGQDLDSRAVIYAAGCRNRKLGADGEDKYAGKGLSYCAVCDGAFFRGKDVAVIGGGDTAFDDALFLSDMCAKVYLIHRRDEFRGSASALEKLRHKENVEIVTNAVVEKLIGSDRLEGILLNSGRRIDVSGVFSAVGMVPQTDMLREFSVLAENGYVKAGEDCATEKDGLYAAGDVRRKPLRQVVTAAADGACAVHSVVEYLKN